MNETKAPIEAFPLSWPVGYPRTARTRRMKSNFGISSFERCRTELTDELRRLGATNVILSTNIPIRKDGFPYASVRAPEDPGVAVYFDLKGKPTTLACDRWWTIAENIRALAKTIEALRGIERWGSTDLVERAFTGFAQLPPARQETSPMRSWNMILGYPASLESARRNYLARAKTVHPDLASSSDTGGMYELNRAWREAQEYFESRKK